MMKMLRFTFAAAVALAFGNAYAFHSGGVAECSGCHSMHTPAAGGANLLVGKDNSSTCLSCHEHAGDTAPNGYHISTAEADMPVGTAPLRRTPGGDFGWLKKSYSFVLRGSTVFNYGQTHGHNIVAVEKSYIADVDNKTAPGGTFDASVLACSSCHDPHGKYRRNFDGTVTTQGAPIIGSGSYDNSANPADATQAVGVYRLLAGVGFKNSTTSTASFTGSPVAVAPATYNRTESATDTRVAYGVGTLSGTATWGKWCGTCHGQMHSTGNYVHPVDQGLGSTVTLNYTQYVKTGDMTGTATNSYLSLVPFAENTATYTTLQSHAKNDGSQAGGPGQSDQVMCLSCHRAHASGFREMLRWNMEGEMITYAGLWPDVNNSASSKFADGMTSTEVQAAYYDRAPTKFASYQRVLCNKCHAKD